MTSCSQLLFRWSRLRTGNINDVNNYRATALSNAVPKIFESILLQHVSSSSDSYVYQFGFKTGHFTVFCTKLLKNVVKYYRLQIMVVTL